jgi:hypothetical protein
MGDCTEATSANLAFRGEVCAGSMEIDFVLELLESLKESFTGVTVTVGTTFFADTGVGVDGVVIVRLKNCKDTGTIEKIYAQPAWSTTKAEVLL